MVRLSDLKTAAEVRAGDMQDSAYRREYERTRLANDVAIKVLQYRQAHGLSQTELAALLDMRQPNIARLEAGEHAPTIETLSRLADALKLDFSVDVKPGMLRLRKPSQAAGRRTAATTVSGRAKATRSASLSAGGQVAAVAASANASGGSKPKAVNPSNCNASSTPTGKSK